MEPRQVLLDARLQRGDGHDPDAPQAPLRQVGKNIAIRFDQDGCTGVNTKLDRFGRVARSARVSFDVRTGCASTTPWIFVSGPHRASNACSHSIHSARRWRSARCLHFAGRHVDAGQQGHCTETAIRVIPFPRVRTLGPGRAIGSDRGPRWDARLLSIRLSDRRVGGRRPDRAQA